MKQSQAQLSSDHETLQSLFGKHNYWKLLTPLSQLRLQRGIIQQSCMPLALRLLGGIDERGRFLKNIPHPFH